MTTILVSAMVLSLTACGGSDSGSGGDGSYRDELNIAVDVDAETYNPILSNNTTGNRSGAVNF